MIYQAQAMNYKSSVDWKNANGQIIPAFRFELDGTKKYDVTVEELTNKTVELVIVFFII